MTLKTNCLALQLLTWMCSVFFRQKKRKWIFVNTCILFVGKQEVDIHWPPRPTQLVHRPWSAKAARVNGGSRGRPEDLKQCPEAVPQRHQGHNQGRPQCHPDHVRREAEGAGAPGAPEWYLLRLRDWRGTDKPLSYHEHSYQKKLSETHVVLFKSHFFKITPVKLINFVSYV